MIIYTETQHTFIDETKNKTENEIKHKPLFWKHNWLVLWWTSHWTSGGFIYGNLLMKNYLSKWNHLKTLPLLRVWVDKFAMQLEIVKQT